MEKENVVYKRILIVGCSGAGKSTLAIALGKTLNIPVVHLDKIWWLPNWQNRTREEFDELLERELVKDEWIIDGDYNRTLAKRLEYADFCIVLDYPQDVCLKGAYDRFERFEGKTRPDMTEGCAEQFDDEFQEWIKCYGQNVRPFVLNTIEKSGVEYKIFTNREQTGEWLRMLEERRGE